MASFSSGGQPHAAAQGPPSLGAQGSMQAPPLNPNPNSQPQSPNPNPSLSKSFAGLFKESSIPPPSIPLVAATTHYGEPAIKFPKEVISVLAKPFTHTLVGKFSRGRPNMDEARRCFLKFGLKADFQLGHIDAKHVLIRLTHEGDFTRLWAKEMWYVGRFPMKVFRWSPSWRPDQESSLFPVWVGLPGLPIHLFNKVSLFSIARIFGEPLAIDQATASLSRPSMAKVLVQVDLLKKLPSRVFIECGDNEGYFQYLEFDNLPVYCKHCFKVGHSLAECRFTSKGKGNSDENKEKGKETNQKGSEALKPNGEKKDKHVMENSKGKEPIVTPKKIWQRKFTQSTNEQVMGSMHASTSHGAAIEKVVNEKVVDHDNGKKVDRLENHEAIDVTKKVKALKPIIKRKVSFVTAPEAPEVQVVSKPKTIADVVSRIVVDEVARAARKNGANREPIRGTLIINRNDQNSINEEHEVVDEEMEMDDKNSSPSELQQGCTDSGQNMKVDAENDGALVQDSSNGECIQDGQNDNSVLPPFQVTNPQ